MDQQVTGPSNTALWSNPDWLAPGHVQVIWSNFYSYKIIIVQFVVKITRICIQHTICWWMIFKSVSKLSSPSRICLSGPDWEYKIWFAGCNPGLYPTAEARISYQQPQSVYIMHVCMKRDVGSDFCTKIQ